MKKSSLSVVFGILFAANIAAWFAVYDLSRHRFLEVDFFDIGQGDAIFIETPKRQQVLIDGGPTSAILGKLAKEMPFWDRTIDLVVLTHPERDHMAGLLEVLKRYKVDYILWTGVIRDTAEYREWVSLIGKEKAKIIIARRGQKIDFGGQGNQLFLMSVFNPLEILEGEEIENSNDTSIVSRLNFKNNSFLFTGDISQKAEKEIIAQNFPLKSDVLKVAHHGSKTSSSEEFLKEVSPRIAVIEVGKNNYGHPTEEVLALLKKFGIEILRTDKQGDVKIISDGNNLKIKTEK